MSFPTVLYKWQVFCAKYSGSDMIMINVTELLPPKIMTYNIWRCSEAVWSYIADLKFCAYRNDPKTYIPQSSRKIIQYIRTETCLSVLKGKGVMLSVLRDFEP